MLNIKETTLKGVYLITPGVHEDPRGCFYETYNEEAYHRAGLTAHFIQDDISINPKGVLKGMHGDPGTTKLVQVFEGAVQAVILNCDESSPDFGKWESFILSAENKHQLYIPPMYGKVLTTEVFKWNSLIKWNLALTSMREKHLTSICLEAVGEQSLNKPEPLRI